MAQDKTRLKGKLTRWLGLTTGDREQEARGLVQQETGHKPDAREQRAATEDIKASHHDFGDPDRG